MMTLNKRFAKACLALVLSFLLFVGLGLPVRADLLDDALAAVDQSMAQDKGGAEGTLSLKLDAESQLPEAILEILNTLKLNYKILASVGSDQDLKADYDLELTREGAEKSLRVHAYSVNDEIVIEVPGVLDKALRLNDQALKNLAGPEQAANMGSMNEATKLGMNASKMFILAAKDIQKSTAQYWEKQEDTVTNLMVQQVTESLKTESYRVSPENMPAMLQAVLKSLSENEELRQYYEAMRADAQAESAVTTPTESAAEEATPAETSAEAENAAETEEVSSFESVSEESAPAEAETAAESEKPVEATSDELEDVDDDMEEVEEAIKDMPSYDELLEELGEELASEGEAVAQPLLLSLYKSSEGENRGLSLFFGNNQEYKFYAVETAFQANHAFELSFYNEQKEGLEFSGQYVLDGEGLATGGFALLANHLPLLSGDYSGLKLNNPENKNAAFMSGTLNALLVIPDDDVLENMSAAEGQSLEAMKSQMSSLQQAAPQTTIKINYLGELKEDGTQHMEITFAPQIEGEAMKLTLLIDNKPFKVEDKDFQSDFPKEAYDLSTSEDMSALSSNSELMPRLMEILQSLGLDKLMDAGSDMGEMPEESGSETPAPTVMESESAVTPDESSAEIPAETTVVAP